VAKVGYEGVGGLLMHELGLVGGGLAGPTWKGKEEWAGGKKRGGAVVAQEEEVG